MIKRLLIANRGEIACRIIRTARRMGMETVAVYSDADADALHVAMADAAIHIGASPASQSYLISDKIIAAARDSGADVVHPGFGFLSENADFAQAVLDAGLIWIGPRPASIAAMGLKDAAKRLMAEAGVPVTPGYMGADQEAERLRREADAIGYPVLIKAVAGGGGKGMRRVERSDDFLPALESCQREAVAAFGDKRVLIEKYITRPRHIEVQVFGDTHGNIIHLFERDCSVQRRHQKVIEEAPAPGMDATTREAICDAAVRAARAVDYVGAGTIEFIADASEGLRQDRIWFMEMNTRLQVEHPVTEEITGVDLVEWQLRIAAGEPLPKSQDEIAIDGWAMEARLYAEDPANDFLPSTGPLEVFDVPKTLRIETGVRQGDVVSPFYDPMIAKLVAHGPTRDIARERLRDACAQMAVYPVSTNARFLVQALGHDAFAEGSIDTGFIDRNAELLTQKIEPTRQVIELAAQSFLPDGSGPWQKLAGFRMNAEPRRAVQMLHDGAIVAAAPAPADGGAAAPRIVRQSGAETLLAHLGAVFAFTPLRADASHSSAVGDGAMRSQIPGRVIVVNVALGQSVTKSQPLLVLEAMKMEYTLKAPFDGVVEEIMVEVGAQVSEGAVLIKIAEHEQ